MDKILEVTGLSVALPAGADRLYAVEDVSFSVARNETVCIIGESGSGKSITASAIMGLLSKSLKPTAGEILLQDENVLHASRGRLRELRGSRMGMVFQEPMTALNPLVAIGAQIEEVLQIHTSKTSAARREAAIESIRAMGLPSPEEIHARYPHQLSGGQRQRVMIAIAMILDPILLIADEPTTALDVTTQAQILQLIKGLQQRKNTGVLFITHDFGVVTEVADRIVVMQSGQIVEQGSVHQVLNNPSHDYTKKLIAAVPDMKARRQPIDDKPIAVKVEGLKKTYLDRKGLFRRHVVEAVNNVEMTLRVGETLGIVGESGSGKTTVARCIARLTQASGGRVFLDKMDIASLPNNEFHKYRSKVQYIFQDPFRSLNPRRTIGATIIEGPINYGESRERAQTQAEKLIGLVGLSPEALRRYPHQFSGGQRQRIAIARALAMKPRILIADEAVSALDVTVQAQILDLLEEIQGRYGISILFITHDLRVAARMCNRIVVMKDGMIIEEGPSHTIITKPFHPYTRQLIASIPGADGRNVQYRGHEEADESRFLQQQKV